MAVFGEQAVKAGKQAFFVIGYLRDQVQAYGDGHFGGAGWCRGA